MERERGGEREGERDRERKRERVVVLPCLAQYKRVSKGQGLYWAQKIITKENTHPHN